MLMQTFSKTVAKLLLQLIKLLHMRKQDMNCDLVLFKLIKIKHCEWLPKLINQFQKIPNKNGDLGHGDCVHMSTVKYNVAQSFNLYISHYCRL